jgi:hypothetical protein
VGWGVGGGVGGRVALSQRGGFWLKKVSFYMNGSKTPVKACLKCVLVIKSQFQTGWNISGSKKFPRPGGDCVTLGKKERCGV